MLKFGIPEKLVKVIRIYVINSKFKVRYNQQISDEFCVETGLRQGDALSPMIFNIALEYIVKTIIETNKDVQIQENTQITVMAYADDIMITAELEANLKMITLDLIEKCKDMGLIINENKTKYMILSWKNHNQTELVVEQMRFERVDTFKYLGMELDTTSGGMKRYTEEWVQQIDTLEC